MQRSALAAILMVATGAVAQPGDNPDHLYPNTASFGVKADPAAPWFQQCMRVRHVPTPPSPPKPAACSDYDYYLKLAQIGTSNAEWGKVRACAAAEQDDAVLAMLHANGQGVPRDLDVATYYACRAGGASAELTERVMHLQALKNQPADTYYDQCQDITSGYMMGMCAMAGENQAAQARDTWLATLRRHLPPQQVGAFDQLVAATRAYSKARGGETDLSGTARAAMVIEAEAGELDWLQEHLAAFEQGKLQLPPARFARADAQLNRRYQALVNTPGVLYGTTTRADVRTAQRAWLVYRDAWVRFAALRYPALPPDALKTALTQWRIKQLDGMGRI